MDERTFKTVVTSDNKLGRRQYVIGVIVGLMRGICGDRDITVIQNLDTLNHTFKVTCYPELYYEFRRTVEKLYPGLCVFSM